MVLAFRYGYYGYGMFFDPIMILVLIGAVLSIWASGRVQSIFRRYSSIRSRSGMTGVQAAERLLNSQGIYDVAIRPVSSQPTDYYGPGNKALNSSESVYQSSSVSAIDVTAHGYGHAIQDNVGYAPLKLRGTFVPVANLDSSLALSLILIGLFLDGGGSFLVQVGIWMSVLVILFRVITLPVEFSTSSRTVALPDQIGTLVGEEVGQARKVLSTAALTYVAIVAIPVLQLLRLLVPFGGRRDND